MGSNEQISQVLQKRLGGDYSVETRVDYGQWDLDSKPNAGFVFIVKNALVESDPNKAQADILKVLSEIEPLKAHIKVETETNHMERLAKELDYFRTQDLMLGESTTIHNKLPEWFRELPKRGDWNVKHALNISKTSDGIIDITINTPSDVAPEEIVKNIEKRKVDILEVLANRVEKYSPAADTPEKKQALKDAVKRLEFSVTSADTKHGKGIDIHIMSPEQAATMKLPGGITPDKVQALNLTNPLLTLQNGEDDLDKTKPQPHLQKALSRAILFAGNSETVHETAQILPYILGKEDMRRMVGKSLTVLKNKNGTNLELVKRIDAFLADPVFKDQNQWGKPIEKQEDIAQAPRFGKMTGDMTDTSKPYEPGVMMVTVSLPADKFPAIRDQIAALDAPAAGAATPSPALDQKVTALAEVVQAGLKNQLEIIKEVEKMQQAAPPAAAQAGILEKAATALTDAANRLVGWVERVEKASAPPAAKPIPSDEALANTILAAAAAGATTTSWTDRTTQNAGEKQVTLGA